MFMKQIAVVGAVLVLSGYLAASDGALAEGQGGLGQRPLADGQKRHAKSRRSADQIALKLLVRFDDPQR